MPMRTISIWIAAAVMFGLCGCGDSTEDFDSVDVVVDPLTEFCAYQTYSFLSSEVVVEPGVRVPASAALIDPTSRSAIRSELTLRGLVETDQDPDIHVNLFYRASNETIDATQCAGFGGSGGYFYYGCDDVTYTDVPFGAEVIDLIDRQAARSFLTGLIEGILTGEADSQRLTAMISQVFASYPSRSTCN